MLRVVIANILMFLLPFLVYGAYVWLVRRQRSAEDVWRNAPVTWLFAIGLVLVVGTLVSLVHFTGGRPGENYQPPRYEDGVLKPGRLE